MPRRPPISTETPRAYATPIEFRRVFAENMDNLHLLSFLLTADLAKAEECFVSGLEDCVEGTYVFRDWAQSWARRTIIQNAIRMLAPRKNHSTVADAPSDAVTCSFGRTQDTDYAIAHILQLEHFERFIFVMSVLEKYSDQDCSVLLGCSGRILGRQERERCCISRSQTGYAPWLCPGAAPAILKRHIRQKCSWSRSFENSEPRTALERYQQQF